MRIVLILWLSLIAFPSFAVELLIEGRASVIDGDTIEIHGQKIRIWGVDAPEKKQLCQDAAGQDYRCGQKAAFALSDFIDEAQPIRCEQQAKDRYKRSVARCFRASGEELATFLVRDGHAVDWPPYSKGFYDEAQQHAQLQKRGVWQGAFMLPWEFRRAAKVKSNEKAQTKLNTKAKVNAVSLQHP